MSAARGGAWRALVAAVLVAPSAASADRYEVSLHVQPIGGVAWFEDAGTSTRAQVSMAGLGLRATYGYRDWLALEAEARGAAFGVARWDDVMASVEGTPTSGDVERTAQTARLTGAATLRLGVAWIPTVSLGLGVQVRRWGQGTLRDTPLVPDGREAGMDLAPVALARVGLDRRLNRRVVVGAAVGGAYAYSSEAQAEIEGLVFASYYFYPAP